MAQGIIVALGKVQASLLSLAHAEEYISMYEAALSHYLELLRMIQTDKVGLRHSAPFMHKFACKRTELCQSKLRTDDKKKEEDWFVGWLVGEPEHPITTTAKCQNKKGALRWTVQIWDARECDTGLGPEGSNSVADYKSQKGCDFSLGKQDPPGMSPENGIKRIFRPFQFILNMNLILLRGADFCGTE